MRRCFGPRLCCSNDSARGRGSLLRKCVNFLGMSCLTKLLSLTTSLNRRDPQRLREAAALLLRLGVWREEGHREVARSAQARGCVENCRDAVHNDGGGGDVAVRSSRNR